ncbi:MAG TPA: dTDP-4-dehydrorhamnose reductase, partial [Bacteroidales bacterium]|nr:dTDP-4-dehydrorhamnose reductase [Bacteroidales bacterium]
MNILVTGARGQLGMSLAEGAASLPKPVPLLLTDLEELDITDPLAVGQFFLEHRPGQVINCAAYTAVDRAETEQESAFRINALAPGILGQACQKYGARLIHLSTDYVFNGDSDRPYREDDPTDPQGVYGISKRDGERAVLDAAPESVIIRTSWLYSEYGHNFVKTMLKLGQEKDELRVVNDQFGSPTYAGDLALAILNILAEGARFPRGIFHYANQGVTTWHGLAEAAIQAAGLPCRVIPIPT